MHAAGFVEDGSVSDDRLPWRRAGRPHLSRWDGAVDGVPDLATPSLGMPGCGADWQFDGPEDAVAFFPSPRPRRFAWN